MEIAVFALFAVLAAAAAYLAYYLRRRRREELAATAFRMGLEFSADDPFGCLSYPFALLARGDGRGVENVMWGVWHEMPLRAFDYWFYEESADSNGHRSRTYHRFSCAVGEVDARCSPLTIDRENVFSALADRVGLRDIEFESEAFNRAFNVKSGDRKFASDLIDSRMIEWLLRTDDAFRFEVHGRSVLVYSKKRRPNDLVPLFGTLEQFRRHVPRVVYELYPVA